MKKIKKIIIGKIGSPYGIYGWNNIISFTEKKRNILNYKHWFIKINNVWIKKDIQNTKILNKKIIVKIIDINNRNQAKNLVNNFIAIKNTTLPKLYDSEYYWKDILNCKVFNNEQYIGKIIEIIRSKNNDILIIQNLKKKKILIPFIEKIFIKKICILYKTIHINYTV